MISERSAEQPFLNRIDKEVQVLAYRVLGAKERLSDWASPRLREAKRNLRGAKSEIGFTCDRMGEIGIKKIGDGVGRVIVHTVPAIFGGVLPIVEHTTNLAANPAHIIELPYLPGLLPGEAQGGGNLQVDSTPTREEVLACVQGTLAEHDLCNPTNTDGMLRYVNCDGNVFGLRGRGFENRPVTAGNYAVTYDVCGTGGSSNTMPVTPGQNTQQPPSEHTQSPETQNQPMSSETMPVQSEQNQNGIDTTPISSRQSDGWMNGLRKPLSPLCYGSAATFLVILGGLWLSNRGEPGSNQSRGRSSDSERDEAIRENTAAITRAQKELDERAVLVALVTNARISDSRERESSVRVTNHGVDQARNPITEEITFRSRGRTPNDRIADLNQQIARHDRKSLKSGFIIQNTDIEPLETRDVPRRRQE